MAATGQHEFKRALNLLDSTTIVVGSMIGSGIFIVSSDIARTVGSPGWLLVTWVLTGIITLIAALSYGELAAMMPNAGGQYVYLRESYGSLVGFLYGWTLFLVIQSGTIAAVAIAFSKFSGVFFPGYRRQPGFLRSVRLVLTKCHSVRWDHTMSACIRKTCWRLFPFACLRG
jgi:APA family basic amino acid/polyamine antiporter